MLKTSETYRVTVVLNDGQATVCALLSKPNATTLAAVASAQKVTAELIEAAAFARDLVIPALGEDAVKTPITVAGTQIGAIHIETEPAFVWQARKPRKPKPATPDAEQAPPATELSRTLDVLNNADDPVTEQATPKRKRRRKKNTDTETTEPVAETTEPVAETTEPVAE